MEVAERQGDEPDRKENLLLLNKADLVSEEQRKIWANYFQKQGIEFIFFSAIEEQEKIEDEKEKVSVPYQLFFESQDPKLPAFRRLLKKNPRLRKDSKHSLKL